MPIEFNCSSCGQRLRVPDGMGGKQTKCPKCEAIMAIPASAPSTSTDGLAATNPSSGPQAFSEQANPYAAPAAATQFESGGVSGPLQHNELNASSALTIAWELFKENMGMLVGAYLIIIGISMAFSVVSAVAQIVIVQAEGGGFPNGGGGGTPASVAVNILMSLASWLVQIWLSIGLIAITLKVAKRQPATVGMLFSGGKYYLRGLGTTIIFGLGIAFGLLLFIVPGIWAACKWWPYLHFIVDRDCDAMESFALAGQHTEGNKGQSFVMGLIALGLAILGAMLCFVGLLFTYPLASVMFSVAYVMMTGQLRPAGSTEMLAAGGGENPFE